MEKIKFKDILNSFIADPGIQLSHPRKEKIFLEDIFVFPDLKYSKERTGNSKELLDIDDAENKIIISGQEDSGKTTLIKVLIKHYLESGYYPVYMDIDNSLVSTSKELLNLIHAGFEQSYSEDEWDTTKTHEKPKKAVFIDNFDKLNSSPHVILDIIEKLYEEFDNVIITEKIPAHTVSESRIEIYPEISKATKHYEILEFSDELRLELIEKWNKIGFDEESDTENISLEVEKRRKFIDTVIGHDLVPSYPIYLLTILQMDNQEESAASASTYSHYYEYIIIKSLQKLIGNEGINNYFDLLSKISFYMFDNNKDGLSDKELIAIFNTSLAKKDSYDDVIQILIKADTLTQEGPLYHYKYQYSYHYFVAKYLSENINSTSIKETIMDLCSELGNDDAANIVLFITHLTDDSFMVDELTESAEAIITDIDDFSSIEDSSEIDELIEELSRLGTKDRKLKEIVAKYSSRGQINDFEKKRQSLNAINNYVRIIRQILKK